MFDTLSLIGDRVIAYRPILRAMGISSTVNGTLLASQLLYLYQQAGRQPFAVTDLELAAQTGLTVDEVRSARADLVERLGAASYFRYERKGMPSRGWYDVDADRINSSTAYGNCAETNQNAPDPSICQFGPEAEHDRATARTCVGHSPNMIGPEPEASISKNPLEEIKPVEPPLPPVEPKPEPKQRDPFAAKKLPLDRIPADLLNVQDLLPEFWAGKKGARSERVFNRVCNTLRQLTPEDRRASLEAAINCGWGDVFPRKAALGLPNGSSRRTSTQITHDAGIRVGELLRANGLG
jgi:hypothetical protein